MEYFDHRMDCEGCELCMGWLFSGTQIDPHYYDSVYEPDAWADTYDFIDSFQIRVDK